MLLLTCLTQILIPRKIEISVHSPSVLSETQILAKDMPPYIATLPHQCITVLKLCWFPILTQNIITKTKSIIPFLHYFYETPLTPSQNAASTSYYTHPKYLLDGQGAGILKKQNPNADIMLLA